MPESRLSYEQSCQRLQALGYLEANPIPPMPTSRPGADDDALGVSFFRTRLCDGADLSDLTLCRTYVCRSEIRDVLLRNTDLSESSLCWNDFTDVDFTGANLARADLRCSIFRRVRFKGCDLRGADLRARFDDCSFDDARMEGAIMGRWQRWKIGLTREQRRVMTSKGDPGIPAGG